MLMRLRKYLVLVIFIISLIVPFKPQSFSSQWNLDFEDDDNIPELINL